VIGLSRGLRAVLVAVAAVVLAGGTLGAASTAAAADPPRVLAVSLSASSVQVDGLALAQVTVTTTVQGWPDDVHSAFLTRTSHAAEPSAPWLMIGVLERLSGAPGAGTYRGTVYVPSSAGGDWRVSTISNAEANSASIGQMTTERDPRADGVPDAALVVHGTHPPRIRLTIEPTPVPYPSTRFKAVAAYDDAATGRPLVGRPVVIAFDNDCVESSPAGEPTDAHGQVRRLAEDAYGFLVCAWAPLPAPAATFQWRLNYAVTATRAIYTVRLGARPARTSVKLGSSTTVDGNVVAVGAEPWRAAAAGTHVRLQRLVGRTWRSVNLAKVASSGRYHAAATPPSRGRHLYRVWFPSQSRFQGIVTATFSITAT
jgi:hypothetical protein